MRISDGASEQHVTPLPLDVSGLPGVAPVGVREPGSDSPANAASQVGGVMPTTAMNLEQQRQGEAAAATAMAQGMMAELGRRTHYEAGLLPLGADYGDQMSLPQVPDNALPAAASYGYPFSGTEPTEAAAGMAGTYPNTGNEPH